MKEPFFFFSFIYQYIPDKHSIAFSLNDNLKFLCAHIRDAQSQHKVEKS